MKFRLILLLCTLYIASDTFSQVVINEFSAANRNHYTDNYGEEEDWIELYNTGAADFDLSGYYLSDDDTDPTKWVFPAGSVIPGNGYLMAVGSDRNEVTGGIYHVNFRISQEGQEGAVLADPTGNIVDSYMLENPNQLDHSRGRTTDGGTEWGVFLTPTPNAPNVDAVPEYAAKPELTDPGFYTGSVNVTMTTTSPNATIRYTLDGTEPTEASTAYTGPVSLTEFTVVRARTFSNESDVPPSLIETNTYLVDVQHNVNIISASGTQLLTLLNGSQIEPVGHLEYFSGEGDFITETSGEFNEHGNDSWAYPQRGIDYIGRDEFGNGHELQGELFRIKDRDKYQRLIIKAAASDNYPYENGGAHIRDAYVQSLSQMAGLRMDERSYEPCVMYINGQYWGVYDLREKVDDHDFTRIYYDQDKYNIDFLKTWGGTWEEYGSGDDWYELRDFILGNDMTDMDNYEYVKSLYNTGSLIDYFILNSYIVSSDWLNWNTGWWRGKNPDGDKKKWRYILWDMDASFDHYANFTGIPDESPNADICDPEAFGDPGGQGHVPIWNALIQNESFFDDYINRYSELASNHFSCEFLIHHLDSLIDHITPEMPQHIDRWAGSMDEWEGNVQNIRDFINVRCEIINGSFLDCYDELSGPYDVTFYADPPLGGTIELPTIEIETWPYDVTYFGGVNVDLEAKANDGFVFSHWSSNSTVFTPDELTEEVMVSFTENDTLIAHFVAEEVFEITLNVEPANTGSITFNGDTYTNFPVTVEVFGSTINDLLATPINGWGFEVWVSDVALDGPPNEASVQLTVNENASVTARFFEIIYEISFDVSPTGSGSIELENELLELPETRIVPGNVPLSISTKPLEPFNEFSHWSILSSTPLPDEYDPDIEVSFEGADHVVANYIELPNYPLILDVVPRDVGCWIQTPDSLIQEFPYQVQMLADEWFDFEAVQRGVYGFSHWEVHYGVDIEHPENPLLRYKVLSPTKLVAHFKERLNGVYVPNSFTPNGDGVNDILKVYGVEIEPDEFRFAVMSRWGGELFSTTDIEAGWNGGKEGSNYYAPPGIYAYFLRYRNSITGEIVETAGQIVLIR